MKTAIIGEEPVGMPTAYSLAKHNYEVEVYEAGNKIGGLAAAITLWNQKVDIGPRRFFSSDKRVNALLFENAFTNLGIYQAAKYIFSYWKEQVYPTMQNGSFQNWIQHRFGKRLFEILFKTYTEKLWGIPCTGLDAGFAAQRIKKLSMFDALKNALLNGNGNKHKTITKW